MKKDKKVYSIAIMALLLLSCEKEQAGNSETMENIYAEQGIPVKTRTLQGDEFISSLTYTSSLKGIKESTGSSMISDAVEEILVKVGDYVEKDQTVITFPKSNISANYFQAEAGFKAADQAFRRVENLYKNNGVSRQSFDDARTQYEVQLANWENVQKLVEVKAPISGYITRINVNPSDNVKPGAELFTVSNYDQLTSTVWVGDQDIRKIANGQNVTALWQDEKISGVVTQVDLAKDPGKKAFAVKIKLENQNHSIPSGITADLQIRVKSINDAIVLHRKEFLGSEGDYYVFLEKEGYARRQAIEPGISQGMYYSINSGLIEGDRIITEGLNLVRENGKVRAMADSDSTLASR